MNLVAAHVRDREVGMDRRNWFFSLVLIVGFLLATDYFFIHFLFPLKKAAMMQEMNRAVDESLEAHPPPATPAPPSEAPTTEQAPSTKNESAELPVIPFEEGLRQCFGDEARDRSPGELLQRWEAANPAIKEVPFENWHLRQMNGQERRVTLVSAGRDKMRGRRELKLYSVNSGGTPEQIPLDPRIALDPSPEVVKQLTSDGAILFHQKQETLRFADGSSAQIEWINQGVRDARFYTADHTLTCRFLDCRCL